MGRNKVVHELTMRYLEKFDLSTATNSADFAKMYLETFNNIEGYLKRHDFDPIEDAPEWK